MLTRLTDLTPNPNPPGDVIARLRPWAEPDLEAEGPSHTLIKAAIDEITTLRRTVAELRDTGRIVARLARLSVLASSPDSRDTLQIEIAMLAREIEGEPEQCDHVWVERDAEAGGATVCDICGQEAE